MSASVRIASHSSVVRARSPSVSTASTASTLMARAAMLAKRGSSISSGRPSAANSLAYCASLEAITLMKPSFVG